MKNKTVTWASDMFAHMMGYEPHDLIGRSTRIFYESDQAFEDFWSTASEVINRGEAFGGEARRVRKDGTLGWYEVNLFRRVPGSDEHESTFVDVSDKHAALDALAAREARLRGIFLAMVEGMVFYGADGRVIEANPAAEQILGVTRDDMKGTLAADARWQAINEDGTTLPGAEFPAVVTLHTGRSVRGQIIGLQCQGRGLRWVSANSQPIGDASPQGATGAVVTFSDITEQREAFQRIQQLAQRIEMVREDERRQIAQELHEGIAQDLFAAQLSLKSLEGQARGRVGVLQAYDEIRQNLNQCMDATRRMANNLRPAAFAHVTLHAALVHHARNFAALSNLGIEVIDVSPFPDIDESTSLIFFRAAQEILTNVAKHARARKAVVRLRGAPNRLSIEVEDDGIGIRATDLNKTGSLGLVGIRERFAALGGGVLIQKRDPCGTRVEAFIPTPSPPSYVI